MIKKIDIKGIGPFSEETSLDFDPRKVTTLSGETGIGKTTVLQAISLALWGCLLDGSPYRPEMQTGEEAVIEVTLANGKIQRWHSGEQWTPPEKRLGETPALLRFIFADCHRMTCRELDLAIRAALLDAATDEEKRAGVAAAFKGLGFTLKADDPIDPEKVKGMLESSCPDPAELEPGDVTDAMREAHQKLNAMKSLAFEVERDTQEARRKYEIAVSREAPEKELRTLDASLRLFRSALFDARAALDRERSSYAEVIGGSAFRYRSLLEAIRRSERHTIGRVWNARSEGLGITIRAALPGEGIEVCLDGRPWRMLSSGQRIIASARLRESLRRMDRCPWWIPVSMDDLAVISGGQDKMPTDWKGPVIRCWTSSSSTLRSVQG